MQHAKSFWITLVITLVAINAVAFADEDAAPRGLALLGLLAVLGAALWARAGEQLAVVGRGLVAGSAVCLVGFVGLYTWVALYMSGAI
jgi:hypothetical protein